MADERRRRRASGGFEVNRRDETAIPVVDLSHSKRAVKRAYLKAEIGLSDAIPELMFDHGMDHSEAICYLMDVR